MIKLFNSGQEHIVCHLYNMGCGLKEISRIYNCSVTPIISALNRNNIKRRNNAPLSCPYKIINIKAIDLYNQGLSINKISDKYNISANSVYEYLKRKNIIFRSKNDKIYKKCYLNENYFENINTEDKAYHLGLFYAEGNIYHNGKTGHITIGLTDLGIMETFHKFMNTNIPLKTRKIKGMKDFYLMNFVNNKMYNDLYNLGVRPNKSKLEFGLPIINKNLYRHFIRGFFDGDGSIMKSVNTKTNSYTMRFALCGNYIFLNDIKHILPIETNKLYKHINIYSLIVSKFKNIEVLYRWLYFNSNIYGKRKYNLWNVLRSNPKIRTDLRTVRYKRMV